MKFAAAALVAAGAATVSAQQQTYAIRADHPKGAAGALSAGNGRLRFNDLLPAECETPISTGVASFYAKKGGLFLSTPEGVTQQVYADMSPEGQGEVRYTQPSETLGKDMAAGGWELSEEGGLRWNGGAMVACREGDGEGFGGLVDPWGLYVRMPTGIDNCTDMITHAEPETIYTPKCIYS